MIRIEEDKEFILDQRCQRKMVMFGEDKELSKLEARNEARKQAERERKLKEEQRQSGASAIVPVIEPLHDESYSDDNDNDAVDNDKMVDRDFEIEIPVYYRQQVSKASSSGSAESSLASTPKRQCILDTILDSPDVSSTLDRINLSDTKFTILAAAIARAGGQNLDDGSLSRSTVRRKRTYHQSNIEIIEKRKMISNMKFHGENWSERLIKLKNIESLEKKSLDMLVTSVSASALRSMKVDIDFLFNNDPATWNDFPEYQERKNLVYSLKVVNDAAERSVALMSMFNESITRNESEMQRLIQVVEDHRKRVPDARKCTLYCSILFH
nr:uncharacterized protein LOC124818345 [Hydra vulgaris]